METFALSRFRRIEEAGRNFERPEGFDARTHAKEALGITGGEKPMKVRLLFEPKLAVSIFERQWHPTQVLKKRRDGRVELRMETTGRKELVRWVLSWIELPSSWRRACGETAITRTCRTRRSTRTASELAVGELHVRGVGGGQQGATLAPGFAADADSAPARFPAGEGKGGVRLRGASRGSRDP